MKVLFVNTLYSPNEIGGAERAVKMMADQLVAKGHQAVVVSLLPAGKLTTTDVIDGVKVYYVPLANIYWNHDGRKRSALQRLIWHSLDAYNPVMGRRVKAILAAEKPDLIETNNLQGFSVAVWHVASQLGIPVVQTLHDYYLGCSNSAMYRNRILCTTQCKECRLLCTARRALSDVPAAVSSVSHRTLERLEAVGMFHSTTLKSINPSALPPGTDESPARLRLAGSTLVLGFLGRVVEDKGIEVLLNALAQSASRASLQLKVGGRIRDDYKPKLENLAEGSDVQFMGLVKPRDFFGEIDVLVVPSLWEEPMPRVIFEAFSFGIPVIVSRLGGMPEAVKEGETGFIFNVEDPAALPNLLDRLATWPWPAAAFRMRCIEESKRFSAEAVFGETMRVWSSVLRQPAPAA